MSTSALIVLIVVVALVLLGILVIVARSNATSAHQKLCGGCRRVMLPVWTRCLFCGWAPVARLEFILGPMANQTLQLSEEVTTIGSVAGNTVVLADPAVSRKHAGIRKVNGLYELADLGSTNGVYVNGHKVPKKTLEPGDIIRVGNTEAVFKPE
ncbi:MAG: FHA domain-containing protein [Deltaproteobacteria bacterium]|nr:MAG: FHA domain-containing protein [Deltaproteobacteria bacterium]